MGWCHEFGPQIRAGCDHPMVAESTQCHCDVCGVSCDGRFKGCEAVWARGPIKVTRVASSGPAPAPVIPEQTPPPSPVTTAEEAPGPPPPPAPPPRRPDHVLHSVSTALETVGAELRAMRKAIDSGRSAPTGAPTADPLLDRLAVLLDQLPQRVRTAVREALAPEASNGQAPQAPAAAEAPPTGRGESPFGLA